MAMATLSPASACAPTIALTFPSPVPFPVTVVPGSVGSFAGPVSSVATAPTLFVRHVVALPMAPLPFSFSLALPRA
ncbi:hypothetical protein TRAPUB_4508 [Trametes pubescens]|uniref:Uncharacterized protein n=1 Tax=Trametes pubescens TaxID=154538 RepID=A0A1M2VAZ0_TRAPU|nr:hypothetical protein TRAPUB_4508 [Trametes pubescens]